MIKILNKTKRCILNLPFPERGLVLRHNVCSDLGFLPVIVYIMGKVGSTSVYESLRENRVSPLIYHVHFLTHSNLDRVALKYSQKNPIFLKKNSGLEICFPEG